MKMRLITMSLVAFAFACASSTNAGPDRSIAGVLASDARFTTLSALLKETGVDEGLREKGPYAIFAPTDAAFAKLPDGALERKRASHRRDKLERELLYHVVRLVEGESLTDMKTLPTAAGHPIELQRAQGRLLVGNAVVTATAAADNGTIYAIDAVIQVPPAVLSAPKEKKRKRRVRPDDWYW